VNGKDQNLSDYSLTGQLPEIGQSYWVQCKNFRCKAVFDKEGTWKAFTTGKELPDVMDVFFTKWINLCDNFFPTSGLTPLLPLQKNEITRSMNDQLGLELVPGREAVEMLVVEKEK
jgi:hypothetical protein